jgi:hypothetical protein
MEACLCEALQFGTDADSDLSVAVQSSGYG